MAVAADAGLQMTVNFVRFGFERGHFGVTLETVGFAGEDEFVGVFEVPVAVAF